MTNFILSPPAHGLIAHRGASFFAPENTFAAFERVSEYALNWIEFDVQLTKDNHLVVFHDDSLNRTTNGTGLVHHKRLAELQALDAGSWFDSKFYNQKIPTFEDTLRQLLKWHLYPNVELKIPNDVSSTYGRLLVDKTIQAIQDIWPNNLSLPLISCFDWSLLHYTRELLPNAPIGFLVENCQLSDLNVVATQNNAAYHCDHSSLTPTFIKQALAINVPILAYTVNQAQTAKNLLALGLFGVFTDNPLLFKS